MKGSKVTKSAKPRPKPKAKPKAPKRKFDGMNQLYSGGRQFIQLEGNRLVHVGNGGSSLVVTGATSDGGKKRRKRMKPTANTNPKTTSTQRRNAKANDKERVFKAKQTKK